MRAVLWILVLLLTIPGLLVGPLLDDWFHAFDSHAAQPSLESTLGLYDLIRSDEVVLARAQGMLPWWSDDALSLRFFRPLSSLVLTFDHVLLDGGGLLSHLHALAWYALTVYAAARVLRLITGPDEARWGTLLYALSSGHVLPLAFAAARHSVVTAAFAFASFECLVRAAQSGRRRFELASVMLFGVALLGGESGVTLLPLALAWAIAELGWARGARLLAPHLLVLGVFALGYVVSGFGAQHSSAYLTPGSAAFFLALPKRWLVLAGALYAWFPADLWLFGAEPVLVATGLVAALAMALGLWTLRRHVAAGLARSTTALIIGTALALVPLTGGIPGGRMLLIPSLGVAAMFGVAIQLGARSWQAGARRRAVWLGVWVASLGIGLGPLFRVAPPLDMARVGRELPRVARELGQRCEGAIALSVGTPDPNATYLPSLYLVSPPPRPRVFHTLSMAPGEHRLTQLGVDHFELEIDGEFLSLPWSRIYRDSPIAPGMTHALDGVSVEVRGAERSLTRLDLRTEPGARLCWLTLRDGELVPLEPGLGARLRWAPSSRPL